VDGQHLLVVLRGGDDGIPVAAGIVDGGQAEGLEVLGEAERMRALGGGALDLLDGELGIPQWDDRERDVPPGSRGAPLVDHPVVVGPDAQEREFLVLGLQEQLPAEAGDRREVQRRQDPGLVHVGEPRPRVVAPRAHLAVREALHRDVLGPAAGHGAQPAGHRPAVLVDPELLAIRLGDDPGRDVVVLPGKPVEPDPRRLDHVVIDRDDPVEVERLTRVVGHRNRLRSHYEPDDEGRLRGMPRKCSAMMLRCTSVVPP
jgi:hypothetical protein